MRREQYKMGPKTEQKHQNNIPIEFWAVSTLPMPPSSAAVGAVAALIAGGCGGDGSAVVAVQNLYCFLVYSYF